MKRLSALLVLAGTLAHPAFSQEVHDKDKGIVTRLGKTVVQYNDHTIQVVIGYRYASTHLNSRWIFLDTFLSAEPGKSIEFAREDIQLVLPEPAIRAGSG